MEKYDILVRELLELKKITLLSAKKVLTMSDCALLTGLSKSHIYKMCSKKLIPHWKSDGGKFTYFSKDEVEAWQLQHRVKTSSELETEAANHIVFSKQRWKGVSHV